MLSISNNNYSDFVLAVCFILVVFFLSFLYIIDIIQKKLTKRVTINELARMPIRERYKYTRYVCVRCKTPQNIYYFNPFFSYMDIICSNCENDW